MIFRTLAVMVFLAVSVSGKSTAAWGGVFPAGYRLSLDAGYNHLNYSEDHPYQPSQSFSNYTQDSIIVGAEVLYYLVEHLNADLGRYQGDFAFLGDVSYSGLPLSSSIAGTTAQVLKIDLRLGWVVPFLPHPFTLNLMAGFYQTNMFVTGDAFGFTKLTGPEFYPILHWTKYSENAVPYILSVFFKLSPVTDGFSSIMISNREVSFGLMARIPTRDQFEWLKQGYERAFTAKVSYTDLEHSFQAVRSIQVSSQNLTVTLGYDW